MSNIAIYSRKSKFTGKGESIENQIVKCKKFIEFKFETSSDNIEILIDEGFSGKNEDRPAYQKLIQKVKSKEIDSIVIYQLNRLGRNARDIHNAMQMCEDLGAVIYSATEGFDSSTSFGRAVIGILASLAQLEREQLAERVKDNMYTLAKMGRWLGGQSPLGFDGVKETYISEDGKQRYITKLAKNEEELKIVKLLFKKYIEEKSLSQVSKWSLTNNLKGKNGGNLDKSGINVILQNPVYVKSTPEVMEFLSNSYEVCGEPNGNGILRYGKEDHCIAAIAKHKGIIDADEWLSVQNILKENTEKAPNLGKTKVALLTGILKCSCGAGMQMRYGKPRKDGTRPYYYLCSMKVNSGGTRCNSNNLSGELVEKKLIEYLKTYSKETLIKKLTKSFNDSKELESVLTVENVELEIDKNNKSIKNLLNKLKIIDDQDVTQIIITEITEMKNRNKELEIKKEDLLNSQSEVILCQSTILNIINTLDKFNITYEGLAFEEKKKYLNELFSSIVYDGTKFNIKFNIKKKLDNAFNTLSSLSDKYNVCHFRPSRFCSLFQLDTTVNSLLYGDLPVETFADRIKKAKLIRGISQVELSELTGLSRSTICELEAGYRDTVTRETLYKLMNVLDESILLDDYHQYILNQEEHISELIKVYGITNLCSLIKSHHTTIYNWAKGKYTITKNKYELIKKLGLIP